MKAKNSFSVHKHENRLNIMKHINWLSDRHIKPYSDINKL